MRVMVVGDSMTQGGEGDFTWRYRLWQWSTQQSVVISFVGPYRGTQEPDEPHPPRPPPLYKHHEPDPPIRSHGGYAQSVSPEFESLHFAVWGRQCAVAKDLIQEVVTRYSPDIVLVMLGFNDIGWFVSDAKGTLASTKQFVANARRAKSNLQFAIANIPQRTAMNGREDLPRSISEYNALLTEAAPSWSKIESPIHVVDVCKVYTAQQASFDGLHPNALGDFQLAHAFSVTLCDDFKIGQSHLAIPDDVSARPLPAPNGFQLVSSPAGVTAVWEQVYGAYGYEYRYRIDGDDFTTELCNASRWDSHWAAAGALYEAKVRALYGSQARSNWTSLASATAHPRLAPPPTDVMIRNARNGGVVVEWTPPRGTSCEHILQYTILWRDQDGHMFFPGVAAFKESPAHIQELENGHTYAISLLTWNTAGEGLPGDWQEFSVGQSDHD